jgi:cell fate regulator YaaT (PSP1 superfamily)
MDEQKEIIVAKIEYNWDVCFLDTPDFPIERGDELIIDTQNGPEIAVVCGTTHAIPQGVEIGKVIRVCTEEDQNKREDNLKREEEAFDITHEKIKKHNLDMKLVSIHYFLDDNKIIFNFTADERVDFRELVKDLASVFKKRIELRQIGARDEAKIIKGTGICGRSFCCTSVKNELQPVTIKMAKDQNLTLNSSKISGACGRLLCCLAYEHEAYREVKKRYPSEGTVLDYDGKKVTLTEINILKMAATLRTENETSIQVPLDRIPHIVEDAACSENKKDESVPLEKSS